MVTSNAAASSPSRPLRASWARTSAALVLGALLGYALKDPSADQSEPARERSAAASPDAARERPVCKPAPVMQPTPTPKAEAAGLARAELELVQERLRAQARTFHGNLRRELDILLELTPHQPPGWTVGQLSQYVKGWSEALSSSPEFMEVAADELATALCENTEKPPHPAQQILYARIMSSVPGMASREALDCYFERVDKEDPVMWEGLAAWRASGLDMPEAVAEIEKTAARAETRRALGSVDEAQAMLTQPKIPVDESGLPLRGLTLNAFQAPSSLFVKPD